MMVNETTALVGICSEVVSATDGWGQALAVVRSSWAQLLLLFFIPVIGILLIGWWTTAVRKANFWIVLFGLAFFEVVSIIVFLISVTS